MTRALALLFPCLAIGCFSPEVSTDGDSSTDGPGSSGTTTAGTDSPTPSGSTDAPETGSSTDSATETATDSVGETDATGNGVDDPPVFESFTVNGSTTPADVAESSLVILLASVSDDEGVATVEFFDGDTLLGVATEEPYRLEVLVTSSNNGGHAYSASATDTSDQSVDSNDVQLGVTIDGGEVLRLNTELFPADAGVGNFGGLAQISPTRLVLSGSAGPSDKRLVTSITLDTAPERINSATIPAGNTTIPIKYNNTTAIIPTTTITDTIPTKGGFEFNTALRYEFFDVQTGSFVPSKVLQFSGGNNFDGARACALVDGFALATGPRTLSAYEEDLDLTIWEAEWNSDSRVAALQSLDDGSVVISISTQEGCQGTSEYCIRKLGPDGSTEWTTGTQSAPFEGGLAPDASNGVFAGIRTEGDDLLVTHLDANGVEQNAEVITFGTPLSTLGVRLVSDGQGGIVAAVAVGETNNSLEIPDEVGVVLRLSPALTEIWRSNGFAAGSRPVALLRSSQGSLYVAGITPAGQLPNAFEIEGDVWLARANL